MRTLRQTIEGMTLAYDPAAANGLDATIQFEVGDPEPGRYFLRLADGQCTFHAGCAPAPTLTISTPADVWQQISAGERSGQAALREGLYQARGDLGLLLKMNTLFRSGDAISHRAPPGQRPAGPLPLPGMHWLGVAFVPWIVFWITFDLSGVSPWIVMGLPFALSGLIVAYREAFNRSTWLERGSLGFFAVAGLLALLGSAWFATWGSAAGTLVMGGIWLGTLVRAQAPLSADYSKWTYVKALWSNSTFRYINAVISLMWGWTFVLSGVAAAAAIVWPEASGLFTTLRHLLLLPAGLFTLIFQRRPEQRRIDHLEQTMASLRRAAWLGLGGAAGLLIVLLLAA